MLLCVVLGKVQFLWISVPLSAGWVQKLLYKLLCLEISKLDIKSVHEKHEMIIFNKKDRHLQTLAVINSNFGLGIASSF